MVLSFGQKIEFQKVWQNMRPNCTFVLRSTAPELATEVSCKVTASQEHTSAQEATTVEENSYEGNVAHITVLENMSKVPATVFVVIML